MTSFAYKVPELWLGDAVSLSRIALASQYMLDHPNLDFHALLQASPQWEDDDSEEEDTVLEMMQDLAHNISFKVGSVGVVEVKGELVNETSYANPWFGVVSYDTIVFAANMLAEDEEVTDIVLSYDTPGGSAAGVDAAGKSLKALAGIKPIYAYSAAHVSSAGYWLAATANKIYGPRTSEVGSIGAVVNYISISRMLKEKGIDVEVIRSGKDKALGGRVEPISDKAKAMLKEKVDTYSGFFTSHVSVERPVSMEDIGNWGQGKTFFMEEAVSIGLADGILDLSGLLARLDKSGIGSNTEPQYRQNVASIMLNGGNLMAKKLEVPSLVEQAPVVEPVGEEPTPVAAAPAAEPIVDPAAEPSLEEAAGLEFFKSELVSTQAALAEATVALRVSNESVAAAQAAVTVLQPIAAEAISDLQVRLGQAPSVVANMPPADLAATYAAARAQFIERYPVGQQSVPDAGGAAVPVEKLAESLGLSIVN